MGTWNALRRARDNSKPNRPVSLCPQVLNAILDEIIGLKSEIKSIKEKNARYFNVRRKELPDKREVLQV
jgi:hypothetical protein